MHPSLDFGNASLGLPNRLMKEGTCVVFTANQPGWLHQGE